MLVLVLVVVVDGVVCCRWCNTTNNNTTNKNNTPTTPLQQQQQQHTKQIRATARISTTKAPPITHALGYPSTLGCIPIYWGTLINGHAFPNAGVPKYVGMHPHILAYSSVRGCIAIYLCNPVVPMCWGTPVDGHASRYTGAPHIWEGMPIYWSPMTTNLMSPWPRTHSGKRVNLT